MARARGTLYPYPTLQHHLLLGVVAESLPETVLSGPALTLNARDQKGAFTVDLKVAAHPDADIAKELELGIEDPADLSKKVKMVVVGSSGPARVRRVLATPAVDKPGESETIRLNPDDYRGRLDIQAFLIYLDGPGQEFENCRCGESEILSVYFDDYDPPPGSDIPSRWLDFADPVNRLDDRVDQFFVVKTETDPPLLLLNSSIPHFKSAMHTGAQHGPRQRIRDATCHRIACQTWQAILSNTLDRLSRSALAAEAAERSVSAAELLQEMSPWRADLITKFVGDEKNTEELPGLSELIDKLKSDPDRVMVDDSTNWVQQHLLKREPFPHLIRFLDLEE